MNSIPTTYSFSYSVVGVDEFVKNLVTSNSIERVESSNLKVASNLVFDLNPKTCLRVVSSKKKDPRWIQLHFKRQNMFTRLNVTVQDRHGNFSIFVIVELSNNRTKFTKCNHESNRATPNNQVHFSFQCPNEGLRGRKIFIRDDKKELNEFHVCEVQVFGTPLYMNSTDCPYIPNIRNGRTKMKKHRLSFVCKKGYVLWGHQEITCTNGKWSSKPPQCRPLTCTVPDESESEDTVFKLPRNVTRIHLGDEASIGTWEIKANFNCVNSTFIHSAQTWPSYSTISLIHTVFIALSLFLLQVTIPLRKNESNPPLSQNSDRDTSTTTIYDDDIHIPDSGSLIRGATSR
ncbi:unnamed protein product [Lepeophtheirus salmonis]|uniref:(salmon louse) hypothetical protein n=1 Tax=Lepeophtheirus salmonis TaxID=72036 RepID=A0A7R8CFS7_LEPSM|nr:unnamed protein product [Lepeophtheirus salmonis]CAF2804010.1 unnamed protein product [Lepeophtheirus salmonis]